MKLRLLIVFCSLLLAAGVVSAQVTEIVLDTVTETHDDTLLLAGAEHVFYLRVTNTNYTSYNPTNGFRIFSEDGAQWSYPYADTTIDTSITPNPTPPPILDTIIGTTITYAKVDSTYKAEFSQFFINHFSLTGSDADTTGFAGVGMGTSEGIPIGWDTLTYELIIQSRLEDAGKHICIDSSWYYPGGTWKWAPLNIAFPQVTPDWSGKQCFRVIDPATGVDDQPEGTLPDKFTLAQNYPNPFNPITTIKFDVPERCHVTLSVFNVLGQKVVTLLDEVVPPGFGKTAKWDGRTANGSPAATGIYFYKLETDSFVQTKKMMLLK